MLRLKVFIVFLLLSPGALAPGALAQQPAPETAPTTPPAAAPQPAEEAQAVFDALITAVQAGDLDGFVAPGDTAFKEALTRPVFEQLCAHIAPRLEEGYEAIFLGELKQQGYRVFLWKMTFKNEGDDVLIKLVMKDGKVGGFFLI